MFAFVVGLLAVYRVTLLVHEEAGPFGILSKWRQWLDGNDGQYNPTAIGALLRMLQALFACFRCLSVWVSCPVAVGLVWYLGLHPALILAVWPALSGGAILAHEVSND